jgi:hypothetical protein
MRRPRDRHGDPRVSSRCAAGAGHLILALATILVGEAGVEPAHRFRYQLLRLARLPFRHSPAASEFSDAAPDGRGTYARSGELARDMAVSARLHLGRRHAARLSLPVNVAWHGTNKLPRRLEATADRADVVPSVATHVPTPKGVRGRPRALLASPQTTLSISIQARS